MSIPTFKLDESFVEKFSTVAPPFGFNGLGEFVYMRTYSRLKEDGTNEKWYETVRRVVEGTYQMQENHIKSNDLGWSGARAKASAEEMYERMFNMKFLPPGRGLWAMGSELTTKRELYAALNNCGFTSTAHIAKEYAEPFCFLMDASMLGIGVGFDTAGAGKVKVYNPDLSNTIPATYVIPDSREGWVESVRRLVNSYLKPTATHTVFDYSLIREAGEPIKGFGGVASGPQPLIDLHDAIREVLDYYHGQLLSITGIVDIMNLVGVCVIAGNVRRTAEISFGEADSEEYLGLKNYRWDSTQKRYVGPSAHRAGHGWTSNNSVFVNVGADYTKLAEMTKVNGEPGYMWLENARAYGRMGDAPDYKDKKAMGGNPCLEQTLEDKELCCLVETFPFNHGSLEDYQRTLKFAYLYAKTVTLGKTPWPQTNRVLLRNRRIGASMTGVAQFIAAHGVDELVKWCDAGYETIQRYDKTYSDWFCVPKSIKTTSIKPSGTVSLLAGATPGCHDPEAAFYIRRVTCAKNSELPARYAAAGYDVEDKEGDPSSVIISFPVSVGDNVPTVAETSLWYKLEVAALLQKHWADNQVSCTISFDPETEAKDIKVSLDIFQYRLKGISYLPRLKAGAYAQMPYEAISKDKYLQMYDRLGTVGLTNVGEDSVPERGCNNDSCLI